MSFAMRTAEQVEADLSLEIAGQMLLFLVGTEEFEKSMRGPVRSSMSSGKFKTLGSIVGLCTKALNLPDSARDVAYKAVCRGYEDAQTNAEMQALIPSVAHAACAALSAMQLSDQIRAQAEMAEAAEHRPN